MNSNFRFLWSLLFLAVIIAGSWVVYEMTSPVGASDDTVAFTVERGQGVNEISNNLASESLVGNQFIFETIIWAKRSEGSIQAGVYEIPKNVTMLDLVNLLVTREATSSEVTITLIEGWTAVNMDDYFVEQGIFTEGEFFAATENTDSRLVVDEEYAFFADKPEDASLEGYLFPDTYQVFSDVEASGVLQKMFDNLDAKLTPTMRQDIASQGRTIFDVITLASIIEREVLTDSDKQNAADVFLKRMEDGIPLQSDATVNYVTGKKTTRPTFADLDVESPYNTYLYRGLPPGPISNPGLASIDAAIYPASNPYYYFLTKDNGEAVFSRTLDEHNANKAKYLD